MMLKRHEAKYIKSGCKIASHFTSDVKYAEREYLPPRIRYHSDGNSIRFHYSTIKKNVEEKEWAVDEPDVIQEKRGVLRVKWDLLNEANH